ncbi:MAG: chorismate-binding protein [Gaiellaceae bacterium]
MTVELGSLAELEPALAREEFDVARVYVGYGACAPSAPEPCRLPKVAYSLEPPVSSSGFFRGGEWHETWSPDAYAAAIGTVREAIREGDVYQVSLVQHLRAGFSGDPVALATALAPLRPLEGAALQGDGWTIVSASPELLLQKRGRVVRTMPIKGTRPAGVPIESAKDAAEHVMIVDLERNDLSRVCVPGSVRWPEVLVERQLAGVSHLVATVEGELRPEVTLTELFDAVLPGGSVTGCPKSSALELIAALEPVGRGASMGALGRVYANGDLDLALTIRTFAVVDDEIHLWVGGGIVWDSVADAEIEESWVKARPLLALAGHASSSHGRNQVPAVSGADMA